MILIYGRGKVGSAIAELCNWKGISYDICDDANPPDSYNSYEIIVPSPGIPSFHALYQTGKAMSELDFAYQFLPESFQIISITGTDGKSTTSWIMYNILEKEFSVKKSVYLSGNFDIPFSATVLDILKKGEKKGIIVVEVSSFMAFAIKKFQSDYCIYNNFKPDHLNWHSNLQEYMDAKMLVVHHTKKVSVINYQLMQFCQEHQLRIDLPKNTRIFRDDIAFRDSTDGENIKISGRKTYKLSDTQFSGKHNAMNILACAMIANEMGICSKRTRKYLASIKGLPHRLEKIGEKNGVIFVEDSKSTSSQSLGAALGSYDTSHTRKNILLIAGGSDKGDSFVHLSPQFADRVKAMICMGDTKKQFIQIAETENIPYHATDKLSEGVNWLYRQSSSGDVVMLSPGCASFGIFRDYLDRANQFRETVQNL